MDLFWNLIKTIPFCKCYKDRKTSPNFFILPLKRKSFTWLKKAFVTYRFPFAGLDPYNARLGSLGLLLLRTEVQIKTIQTNPNLFYHAHTKLHTVELQFLEPPLVTKIGSRNREVQNLGVKLQWKQVQGKQLLVREIRVFEKSRVWEIEVPLYFAGYLLHMADRYWVHHVHIWAVLQFVE